MTFARRGPTVPACYGIVCPRHAQCLRYAAVEFTPMDLTIATCSTSGEDRPLFEAVPVKAEEQAA